MTDQWYIARDKKKHGPYSSAQMRQMAKVGQLPPADMVLEEGTPKWVPASKVQAFFPFRASESPKPTTLVPTQPLWAKAWHRWKSSTPKMKLAIVGGASSVSLLIMCLLCAGIYGLSVRQKPPQPQGASQENTAGIAAGDTSAVTSPFGKDLIGYWKLDQGSRPGVVQFTAGGTVLYAWIDPGFTDTDTGERFPPNEELTSAKYVFLKSNVIEIRRQYGKVQLELEFLSKDEVVVTKAPQQHSPDGVFSDMEGKLTRTKDATLGKTRKR